MHLIDDPFSSSSPRAESTLLYHKFKGAASCSGNPAPDVHTPEISDEEDGSDYLSTSQSSVLNPTPKPRTSSRQFNEHGPPVTPMHRHQRELITAQDESRTEQASKRRIQQRPTSPADIEGGYEYVVPEKIRYSGDVPASRAGSLWTGEIRSLALRKLQHRMLGVPQAMCIDGVALWTETIIV